MSSTEQVDPEVVAETRQQIRGLVDEIAGLARSDISAQEFYTGFLDRVLGAIGAVGGAVWVISEAGQLELAYHVNLPLNELQNDPRDRARHGRLLQHAMTQGDGLLVAPQSGTGDPDGPGNPTRYLLVLGPLKSQDTVQGVVEVFQRPDTAPATQRGFLNFLLNMCALAAEYIKNRQLRQFTDRQVLWSRLESFTRASHASLDPRETAFTIANEGRRLLECDRVSVAIRYGNRCRVEAISGQDTFDKRSNAVKLLNELATAVVRTGDPMWYAGDATDLAPQVEEAVQTYVDDSHSKTVAVLPLARPADTSEGKAAAPTPVGALIIEQIDSVRPREGLEQRLRVVGEHSAAALANALEHQNLFLMPLWRAIGRSRAVVAARNLPKTLLAVGAVVATIVALVAVPWDFELKARGTLLPVERRDVFAPQDGTVVELFVEHNSKVAKDQELARLRNTDLDVRLAGVQGEILAADEEILALNSMLLDRELPTDQKVRVSGQLRAQEKKRESLSRQLKILEQEEHELLICSPLAGQVITWDVDRKLNRRHVSRGQIVLQVADPSSDWEIEVLMPEKYMGHLVRAQQELGKELGVTYILATDPDRKQLGVLTDVHASAEVDPEDGNTVKLLVKIDKEQLGDLRPGTEVTARVNCGRRPLGYVLFHEPLAWLYKHVLFRL
ncbi:MAG: HlyD family efflux transporter periplasmic adaptor subunit [Pirellulales bacterium]